MKRHPHISLRLRWQILKRDHFRCVYCGATPDAVYLQVDHIIPVSGGGETTPENLATACGACNLGKGTSPLTTDPVETWADSVRLASGGSA